VQLIRYRSPAGAITVALATDDRRILPFPNAHTTLHDLLHLRAAELRAYIEQVARLSMYNHTGRSDTEIASRLAPLDGETEVWAAGVTYKRSEEARREESDTPDIYSRVYSAKRPELFFKATPRRVSGPLQPVAIRSDSTWDVPEPELAIVTNTYGEIVGYTVGNDMSSRSIEGENPLYLPQAKVYAGSCAIGPGITPAWELPNPYSLTIRMHIERGGKKCWEGHTSTRGLKRRLHHLAQYLYGEDVFPDGALLCTGTALVPDHPLTLQQGDIVEITIDRLGTLRNPVVKGKAAFLASKAQGA